MKEQVLLNLTAQLTEMNSLIKKLNEDMQILRDENTRLKNENALLKEENEYLKKKLFGTKSETSHSLGFGQLSFFDEAETECEAELLEDISYKRRKKKHKDFLNIILEALPSEEVLLTLAEEERICPRCGHKLNRVGKEFVRNEVQFIPARLKVKKIYRETFECRNCKKEGNIMMIKTGIPAPVIPHFLSRKCGPYHEREICKWSPAIQAGSRMEKAGIRIKQGNDGKLDHHSLKGISDPAERKAS